MGIQVSGLKAAVLLLGGKWPHFQEPIRPEIHRMTEGRGGEVPKLLVIEEGVHLRDCSGMTRLLCCEVWPMLCSRQDS